MHDGARRAGSESLIQRDPKARSPRWRLGDEAPEKLGSVCIASEAEQFLLIK